MTSHRHLKDLIVIAPGACQTEQFAAQELTRYLKRMTGRAFRVREARGSVAGAIHVRARRRRPRVRVPIVAEDETHVIDVKRGRVDLVGGSPRAALYAVYAFLEELGCRWFAPGYDFYAGIGSERVPRVKALALAPGRRVIEPSLLYREVLIEECRSHTTANARALIDWMSKARLNVFHAPIDYQHSGRFTWESARGALVPELEKRGLIVKVGGHGYENFLHADEFFEDHPEWFAMIDGTRSRNPHHVFETGNPRAMRLFARRVGDYLETHPEIHMMSLWPPDIVSWGESPESLAQGSPSRRQALVTRAVNRELKRRKIHVTLETVTYDQSEKYPEDIDYDQDVVVMVDYYYQEHTGPIFDPLTLEEGRTLAPLDDWTAKHKGPLSCFHYQHRYVWQSRPVILPTIIWCDLRYLYDRGIRGAAGIYEPGDWLAVELQHLLFARLSLDAAADIRRLVADYCRDRFGPAAAHMERYFWTLEKTTTRSISLFSGRLPTEPEIAIGRARLADCKTLLRKAGKTPRLARSTRALLERMKVTLRGLDLTLDLHDAQHAQDRDRLEATIRRYLSLVRRNPGTGLFLDGPWLNRNRFLWLFGETLLSADERECVREQVMTEL